MKVTPARRDGDATRQQLLDAAERLFATFGVDAVSVRTINSEADVAAAATHYHFGSRDGLLEAVLDRRGQGVMAAQEKRAEALEKRRGRPSARELIELVGLTLATVIDADPIGGRYWTRIVSQLSGNQDQRLLSKTTHIDRRIFDLVARAYPDVDPAMRELRWLIASMAVINLLGSYAPESAASRVREADAHSVYLTALVDFAANGLDASMRGARRSDAASTGDSVPLRPTMDRSATASRPSRRPRRSVASSRR